MVEAQMNSVCLCVSHSDWDHWGDIDDKPLPHVMCGEWIVTWYISVLEGVNWRKLLVNLTWGQRKLKHGGKKDIDTKQQMLFVTPNRDKTSFITFLVYNMNYERKMIFTKLENFFIS